MNLPKYHKISGVSSVRLALLLLFLAAGCQSEDPVPVSVADSPRYGGTLVYGKGQDAVRLDPADITDGESAIVCRSIFEGLVRYKLDSTEVAPCLAETWEVSDNGLIWTFHLRPGVKFHDGTPCDAEAVEFSFERQRDPEHPYHLGQFVYWQSMFQAVERVHAVGPLTVAIELNRPYAPLLSNLAMFSAAIVSPAAVRRYGRDFNSNPVGTGPFRMRDWRRQEKIVLEAFAEYWDGRPYLDRLIFKPVPDNTARLLQLVTGAVDVMDGINPEDLEAIRKNSDLKLLEQPGMNLAYLAFNQLRPPFDDRRVRLAVRLAVDRAAIVEHLYYGTAIPAVNPLPPTLWGYNSGIALDERNLEKARTLLNEAGHPNGFETTLWAMSIPRPYLPQPKKAAEIIKQNLADIGIDVKIISYEWGTYLEKTQKGEHDMCLLGWSADNGDPDNFLYVLLDKDNTKVGSASNVSFYRSDELHEVLLQAQDISDLAERARLYRLAQEIIYRDAPMIPLSHVNQTLALSRRVHDLVITPMDEKYFHRVWISPGL